MHSIGQAQGQLPKALKKVWDSLEMHTLATRHEVCLSRTRAIAGTEARELAVHR